MWRRRLKFRLLRFLRLRGTPGKVALGFALGACVNFYPTFGFGLPVAIFIVSLVRGSVPAGIISDLLFKALFPIFFYLNFLTGGRFGGQPVYDISSAVKEIAFLKVNTIMNLGSTFLIGAFVNSLILGGLLFVVMYIMFKSFRKEMIVLVQERIKA